MILIEYKDFNHLPEKLKRIILDLETNFKIIKRIPEGILFNRENIIKFETQVYQNYTEKEREYIKYLFSGHKTFLQYLSLFNSFSYYFPEEINERIELEDIEIKEKPETKIITNTNVSSGTKKDSKNDKSRGLLMTAVIFES